jgi:hypothetical protein
VHRVNPAGRRPRRRDRQGLGVAGAVPLHWRGPERKDKPRGLHYRHSGIMMADLLGSFFSYYPQWSHRPAPGGLDESKTCWPAIGLPSRLQLNPKPKCLYKEA